MKIRNKLTLRALLTEAAYAPQYITKADIDRNNYYFQRFNHAVGSFVTVLAADDHILFPLDSADRAYLRGVRLKPGEEVFRYRTTATDIGKMKPLVKINAKRGLVYHLTKPVMSGEQDEPEFEPRGVKMRYLKLLQDR